MMGLNAFVSAEMGVDKESPEDVAVFLVGKSRIRCTCDLNIF
jgi:hypothetical protein